MKHFIGFTAVLAIVLSAFSFGFFTPVPSTPIFHPTVAEYQFISSGVTPPTEAQ